MIGRLAVLLLLTLAVPLGLRALDATSRANLPPSYLPALEATRERLPFDPFPRERINHIRPKIEIIGDSMAGTRVDVGLLERLSGGRAYAIVHAGSGPAFWYLALKNWVIASSARPRHVLIFFRDTNLTDVMFRLDEAFRWNVDRAAGDREPELDQVMALRTGVWRYQIVSGIDALYSAHHLRARLAPAVGDAPASLLEPDPASRQRFVSAMNSRMDFLHMRPALAADIETAVDREADFDQYIDRSVLPLMLRDAKNAGVTLCFVRVQRRPSGAQPPPQSAALRRYIARLSEYVRQHGAVWRDDTGDPALTLDMYGDGDHLAREAMDRYTAVLWHRLQPSLN